METDVRYLEAEELLCRSCHWSLVATALALLELVTVERALDHYCQFTHLMHIPRIHVLELIGVTHVVLGAYLGGKEAEIESVW
jgi:hypothetical protein